VFEIKGATSEHHLYDITARNVWFSTKLPRVLGWIESSKSQFELFVALTVGASLARNAVNPSMGA